MKSILAISFLALRTLLRSRVVWILGFLLLAVVVFLPLLLRGDGTPEGLIRIHLTYVLGLCAFFLTLATLWAGCASISQEADDKTIQLLLVKPVPRHHIWLGKWLALLILNAELLVLVGVMAAASLFFQLYRGGFDSTALATAKQTTLTALQTVRAPLPDLEADVSAEFERLAAGNRIPTTATPEAVRDSIRQTFLTRHFSVAPGESRAWHFDLHPELLAAPGPILLQYQYESSLPGALPAPARIQLDMGATSVVRDIRATARTQQTLVFSEIPKSAETASVTFYHHGTPQAGTLFFAPSDGLILRQPAGTFAGNFARALLQLYFRLALFAAIGVTLGTLFSMPVATFLTLVLVMVLQLSGFIRSAAQVDRATFIRNVAPFGATGHGHEGEAAQPSFIARATAGFLFYTYRATYLALNPLLENDTLDSLAAGTFIPPRKLARDAAQQLLLLPLLLGLLCTAVLKKREWALPTSS